MEIKTNLSDVDITVLQNDSSKEEKTVNVKSLDKRVKELESKLDMTAQAITKINERLDAITTPNLGGVNLQSTFKAPEAISSDYKPKGYVPQKYRQIVDEILSSEFGVDCIENAQNMDFELQIIVPEKYNSLTVVEKQAGMKDIRSRVISRALGENGVRDWCIKVRENLNKFYTRSGVKSPFVNQ